MTDITTLSPEKQAILKLSDSQIRALLNLARKSSSAAPAASAGSRFSLPEQAQTRLKELELMERRPGFRMDPDDAKWKRYIKVFQTLDTDVPTADTISDRALYDYLKSECDRRHLPPTFATDIIPSVITYFKTGEMKPILFPGPAGCGKTTAGKFLAELMAIPLALISAPRAEHGHGYQGEGRVFRGGDIGEFAQGIIRNRQLRNLFLIDELDKAAQQLDNRVRQQDELLNILSDMCVNENFLELPISIRHSPVIIAVNDPETLSEPFRDRCSIIEFHAVEPDRLNRILLEYASSALARFYKGKVVFDPHILANASEQLYRSGVTSIRQHQQLVDYGLKLAYCRYLESRSDAPAPVLEAELTRQIEASSGRRGMRKIGF